MVFITKRKYKTHYFTKDNAEAIIEKESYLDRKLAFQIAYDTGARSGEIIKIRAEHFNFDKGFMILWDSKKNAWKNVPLSEKTINMAQMYLRVTKKKASLFEVHPKTLNNWLMNICSKLNITADRGTNIRWHSWRGTFVRTHRTLGDKWLMQVTGDSYQTLLNYYEELTNDDLKKAKDKLENEN